MSLEQLMDVASGVAALSGLVVFTSNTIEFGKSYLTYRRYKREDPQSYREKIDNHYLELEKKGKGECAPVVEVLNLPGAWTARDLVW